MTPEFYANLYKQYATFMGDWSNTGGLFRIASGANEADYHWTEVLMRDIPKHMIEGVALHSYSVIDWGNKGSDIDFSEKQYFQTMQKALRMEELINKHVAIMDKYDPSNEVALVVDEWGGWYNVAEGTNPGFLYQQNTMRDAMIAGTTLNIFNNHAERVKMANLAQTVNVLQAVALTKDEKMLLTPTYYVMKMYTVHHDAELIPLQFDSPKFQFENESLPAISASASKDKDGMINISIVNIDSKKSNSISLDLSVYEVKKMKASILTSGDLQDHNTFEESDIIQTEDFKDFKIKKGKLEMEIPPFSVVVLEQE